jgi:hypothetical protein
MEGFVAKLGPNHPHVSRKCHYTMPVRSAMVAATSVKGDV